MHGRTLATIEKVICIYTPDSEFALEQLREWVDNKENINLETVPIGENVTKDEYDREEETLGVTVGGDGAFLEGVREFSRENIPMLGVNTGTLAFLARVSPNDLRGALDEIVEGRSEVASRQRVNLMGAGLDADGINDIMVQPIPPENPVERKIATLHVYVDEEYVGEYTGSGVAVSTPTGSTGVSLSANGPIHYPTNNLSLQIVPLKTHNMGVRPLIVSSESTVTIIPENDVQVLVDGGRHNVVAGEDDRLTLTGADSRADIIRTSYDDEFFNAMTKKLGWGVRDADDNGPHQVDIDTKRKSDLYERARNIAEEAAKSAGEQMTKIHGDVDNVTYKKDKSDMVTEADYQAEQIISTTIKNEFPEHIVLSEESWAEDSENAEYKWVIDPLDGTGNFTHGNPNYSISIALVKDSEPVVGLVYQPETDEVFSAIKGRGATADGHQISVSDSDAIDESMMLSGYDPDGDFTTEFYQKTQGVRAIGSAALNMCYLATGAADAMWEYDTYPWDVAAGMLILREAGGKITNQSEDEYKLRIENASDVNRMVASNGRIHSEVCSQIIDSDILTGD
jgi:myo-inositol-1(or 4)-monophosphatase